MKFNNTILIFSILILNSFSSIAQFVGNKGYFSDSLFQEVPTQRVLYVNRIENVIKNFDRRDGKLDQFIKFKSDEESLIVTNALLNKSKELVYLVENLEISSQEKVHYHRIVEKLLKQINQIGWNQLTANFFPNFIENSKGLIIADVEKKLPKYVEDNYDLAMMEYLHIFENSAANESLYTLIAVNNPEKLIDKLPTLANEPYADKVVIATAKLNPGKILDYAMSHNQLSAVVKKTEDPLVKSIINIADNAKNKLKVLPFLGAIQRGEKSIQEIDNIANNNDNYFQALVDLIVANENLGRVNLEKEINVRAMEYVREINALHKSSDAVRFKCLQDLRDIDLYVIIISGQEELYTSSYTRGTFAGMIKKMGTKTGKELLNEMNDYYFRTFIRVAAGFGRLDHFLKTFDENEKTELLSKFVADIEQGPQDGLPNAVDVADAFGSIKDKDLLDFLRVEVDKNLNRVQNIPHKKGIIIYSILQNIFNENSDNHNSNLSVPPITYVPLEILKNEKGEIIEQMFFYGDGSGKSSYNLFLSSVRRDGRFIIKDEGPYWIKISSKNTTNPLIIYCNKPLTEPQDEVAQRALYDHFQMNDITPTVMVHRGHSYFVPATIDYITPDVKLVVLGSCGGYQNLSDILKTAEDAHIISSKQVGTGPVNEAILRNFHNDLMTKEKMDWPTLWNKLEKDFKSMTPRDRELFADYIPPHRNLGAIFIKTFNLNNNLF